MVLILIRSIGISLTCVLAVLSAVSRQALALDGSRGLLEAALLTTVARALDAAVAALLAEVAGLAVLQVRGKTKKCILWTF